MFANFTYYLERQAMMYMNQMYDRAKHVLVIMISYSNVAPKKLYAKIGINTKTIS